MSPSSSKSLVLYLARRGPYCLLSHMKCMPTLWDQEVHTKTSFFLDSIPFSDHPPGYPTDLNVTNLHREETYT